MNPDGKRREAGAATGLPRAAPLRLFLPGNLGAGLSPPFAEGDGHGLFAAFYFFAAARLQCPAPRPECDGGTEHGTSSGFEDATTVCSPGSGARMELGVCARRLSLAGAMAFFPPVRENLGIGFPGGTYEHLFYVADVEASGAAMNGELHVGFDTSDFLAVFPMKGEGNARLIGTVQEGSGQHQDNLSWSDVSRRVIAWMQIDVAPVNWFSTYHVHHRVADHFRKGRSFLLGDAAHIHSLVGGQDMNTGIGDAVNLAWKLAAVLNRRVGSMTPR